QPALRFRGSRSCGTAFPAQATGEGGNVRLDEGLQVPGRALGELQALPLQVIPAAEQDDQPAALEVVGLGRLEVAGPTVSVGKAGGHAAPPSASLRQTGAGPSSRPWATSA